ncbi:hypothetical protein BGY98DRAFT_1140925 [Russula aff. rugulosa BPL654]|nr:hypothetical protein BGY98DRAFT_1140925 [Russula aff. rugulosa BPL654]
MATDLCQSDIEDGPSPSSLHYTPGFGGSTTFDGRVGSPQSMYVNESIIEEKAPQDDGHGRSRTFMSDPHRRDTTHTSLTTTPTLHGDPSSKIWGLYLSQAEKIDKEHSESWTANTDGVLVFTGLFSAVVATFLVVSYPLLQPSPTDTTNQLLTQISQQLSTNGTGSQPLPPANTPSFQPPLLPCV